MEKKFALEWKPNALKKSEGLNIKNTFCDPWPTWPFSSWKIYLSNELKHITYQKVVEEIIDFRKILESNALLNQTVWKVTLKFMAQFS